MKKSKVFLGCFKEKTNRILKNAKKYSIANNLLIGF